MIGTVQGDIHEIGKSLVATMLSANGFEVHDLGVDVPVETFIATVSATGAHILGLSALLTTTMGVQKKVIEALVRAGLRARVKVMLGGAPVSHRWAEEIGADGYAEDAVDAVALARRLVGKVPNRGQATLCPAFRSKRAMRVLRARGQRSLHPIFWCIKLKIPYGKKSTITSLRFPGCVLLCRRNCPGEKMRLVSRRLSEADPGEWIHGDFNRAPAPWRLFFIGFIRIKENCNEN